MMTLSDPPPAAVDDYAADIDPATARRAHAGTSHDPERRGDQVRSGYSATLTADLANLSRLATTDEKREILAEEFQRYRAGYRAHTLAHLAAQSQCLSTMIAGPSNFNVARARKRNATEDKRRTELLSFRERALAAIRKKLTPELAPIMAGDSDAVARLRADLAKREALQAKMKAANAAIRKHAKAGADAQIAALAELGISAPVARELLKPDFCGRIGYADFETKNNGARIRDIEKRIAALEVAKATPATEIEGTAATIEEDAAANRIRLTFPGKPDAAVRDKLKRSGFRWTPSLGVWQAYINTRAREVAREIAGVAS